MKKTKAIIAALGAACFSWGMSGTATAGEYDFDWKNKNDMRGAWLMCATTGFTLGDCPKVLTKCWQRPMIYRKRHKIRTHCVGSPSFAMGQGDVDRAIAEATRRADGMNGRPSDRSRP